ncbi:Uncharacterised protein [BD1-7 clade bacterium]|uniref:TOD1/MUCI70 glycosyltransferase-like domain-containing protein n=1 Tax=BD1-7 clade bacterium TaxID=2029982 RepID=A0A5S9MSP7_9GAMM|nr:Uncharacterised protein [BD1-7 clade bacterium]
MQNNLAKNCVIYTCVIDNYDKTFPAVRATPGIDFILFSNTSVQVVGWKTIRIDSSRFESATLANRYYKFFAHEVLDDYTYSMYIDGNIRVLTDLSYLFSLFSESGCTLGLLKHPYRKTLPEEIARCKELGVLDDNDAADCQLEDYKSQGFKDDLGLTENNVIFRNHSSDILSTSMETWWNELQMKTNRDQLSLGYVRWKHNLSVLVFEWNARQENPYLYLYPHTKGSILNEIKVSVKARRFDSLPHKVIYRLWQWLKKCKI